MTTPETESPKVFVSYTHDSLEHMDHVLTRKFIAAV
jgi:hypothetical protein